MILAQVQGASFATKKWRAIEMMTRRFRLR
jgi:hypothetical protein